MTCATQAYTDKGKLSASANRLYPPRTDLVRATPDSPSVEMFKALNPFDAVSQATPAAGQTAQVSWPIPQELPTGDYVMWVEVSQAFDYNASYNDVVFPPPPGSGEKGIQWSGYGLPYRGQPSVVYQVPFSIGTVASTARRWPTRATAIRAAPMAPCARPTRRSRPTRPAAARRACSSCRRTARCIACSSTRGPRTTTRCPARPMRPRR